MKRLRKPIQKTRRPAQFDAKWTGTDQANRSWGQWRIPTIDARMELYTDYTPTVRRSLPKPTLSHYDLMPAWREYETIPEDFFLTPTYTNRESKVKFKIRRSNSPEYWPAPDDSHYKYGWWEDRPREVDHRNIPPSLTKQIPVLFRRREAEQWAAEKKIQIPKDLQNDSVVYARDAPRTRYLGGCAVTLFAKKAKVQIKIGTDKWTIE